MSRFTQKQLLDLGFEKNFVSAEESGGSEYNYYTLNLDDNNYTICLISGEFENDVKEVNVQFFEGTKNLSEEFILAIKKEFGL